MRAVLPLAAIALLVTALIPTDAQAATVLTVDDVALTGEITSFDGQLLTITENNKPHPTTLPIADVIRVSLRPVPSAVPVAAATPPTNEGGPTPTNRPASIRRTPRRLAALPPPTSAPASQASASTQPSTTATTLPTANPLLTDSTWRIRLNTGDALHGTLTAWSNQQFSIRPDAAPNTDIALVANSLQWLWHGDASQQAKAEALHLSAGTDDIAFVRKENGGEVVPVHGNAAGIDGDSLLFHFDGDDRRVKFARLVGILFAEKKPVPDKTFHQVVKLTDGEQLSGIWKSLSGNALLMSTGGSEVSFPLSSVAEIEFRNGRLTYLSDLTPAKVEELPYFDRVLHYHTDTSLIGGPLTLSDGSILSKGLAVHSRCVLEYDISRQFSQFKCKLGFEPGATNGRVNVRVLADGKPLFENADFHADEKPVQIDVNLAGANKLTLEVDFGQGQDVGDRVVWGMARVLKAKAD